MEIYKEIYTKTGGFMKGICHPGTDYAALTDAGLGWVRRNVPYPFDNC